MTQMLTTAFFDVARVQNDHVILINVFGANQSDTVSLITAILARYGVTLLDIEQTVVHNYLNIGMLVAIPKSSNAAQLEKDIRLAAQRVCNQVEIESVGLDNYTNWVGQRAKARHIITLLGRQITIEHINLLTTIAVDHGLSIEKITRLSGAMPLDFAGAQDNASIEFSASGTPKDITVLRAAFMTLASSHEVDIVVQEESIFRCNRRLVCFDMDSTLIEAEVIDELAIEAGVGDQVANITARAMSGELDFDQSFAQRMALLEGLSETTLASVASRLRLMEGAEKLFKGLNSLGCKTAILSGGFDYFAHYLQNKFAVDYVYANQLDIVDGVLSGRVKGDVINGERKASLLRELAEKENISLEQVVAVGDGANDIPMLSIAGLGVAFRAKPLVKASAKYSISQLGLDAILYLMGLSNRDLG